MVFFSKLRSLFVRPPLVDHRIAIAEAIAYLKLMEYDQADAIPLPFDPMPVFSDFVGDLCVGYVVDVGPALQFVQGKHLSPAGIDRDQLHQIGVANLTAKLSDSNLGIRKMDEIYVLSFDSNFEASFMLADKLWDEILADRLLGDVIAAIPWRDVLIFCDASSNTGIDILKTQIDRITEGTHRLSKSLFIRDRATKTWRVLSGN